VKLQLKRSSTLVSGSAKPPLATQLAFGELAINFNTADPKLFFKDSTGNVLGLTDGYLKLSTGGTLSGDLILNGDPTSALMPATKQYTDTAITNLSNSISYPVTSVNSQTGAVSLDYTNVGAPSTSGANATGSNWNIGILGNSATTTKLATTRNIALTGDVTGSVNFDGTSNVTISAVVVDDSHNHVISNIDGLQTALNGKQDIGSPSSNALQLNGKADTSFVQTTNLTSLNSDSRNTRGVTRLYRRDNDSDYSVQTNWTGTNWRLRGYIGDTYHAPCEVGFAETAAAWATARTITFTGDATGSLTLDGTQNKSVAMQVLGNSHVHSFNAINDGDGAPRITFTGDVTNGSDEADINSDTVNIYAHDAFKVFSGGGSIRFNVSTDQIGNAKTIVYNELLVTGFITSNGDITANSDISLKENIEVIPDALKKIQQIRGVSFDRKDIDNSPRCVGVIAQEVEEVLPEVVKINEDGIRSVAYGNMVALLIEAVKELKQEVNNLKGE